jgi:two-component system sensor histidine kinase RegB
VLYGLGNILENAVDFARERVQVEASWTADAVAVVVGDDGSGFPPEIIDRMGEPYVTSERGRRMRGRELPGLGLGFFIAKTLLARAGAKISLENRKFPQRGAIVRIRWKRADFERPVMLEQAGGAVDAPGAPGIEPNIEAPPLAESG